jgi:hypothetical protein
MNSKSNPNLDSLIKRIYSFYIDIKSGDFKEIDKDILLGDISSLYTSIKEMYPSSELNLVDFEATLVKEKANQLEIQETFGKSIEIESKVFEPIFSNPIEIVPLPVELEQKTEPIEEIQSKTTVYHSDDFDLSDYTEEIVQIKKEETPVEIPKQEETNTVEKKTSFFDKFKSIPNLVDTAPPVGFKKEETGITTPIVTAPIIEEINQNTDNKSTGKIMDFLHDGEHSENKDIYNFLDINTRIGLVELFFKGNSLELTASLVKINKLTSKSDCIQVINKYAAQFGVTEEDDIYQTFVQLIDRKFN